MDKMLLENDGGIRPTELAIQVGMTLAEVERLLIEATVHLLGGNISQSAKMLGIDRSTLYGKLKKYRWSGNA